MTHRKLGWDDNIPYHLVFIMMVLAFKGQDWNVNSLQASTYFTAKWNSSWQRRLNSHKRWWRLQIINILTVQFIVYYRATTHISVKAGFLLDVWSFGKEWKPVSDVDKWSPHEVCDKLLAKQSHLYTHLPPRKGSLWVCFWKINWVQYCFLFRFCLGLWKLLKETQCWILTSQLESVKSADWFWETSAQRVYLRFSFHFKEHLLHLEQGGWEKRD